MKYVELMQAMVQPLGAIKKSALEADFYNSLSSPSQDDVIFNQIKYDKNLRASIGELIADYADVKENLKYFNEFINCLANVVRKHKLILKLKDGFSDEIVSLNNSQGLKGDFLLVEDSVREFWSAVLADIRQFQAENVLIRETLDLWVKQVRSELSTHIELL